MLDNPAALASGLTLPALADFYRNLKNELIKKINDEDVHGTVEWREIESLSPIRHGDATTMIIQERGKYFCGRS